MDFSTTTRISGLASGMDTDSLVKKLMQAESAGYNKMNQQKQKLQWESDAYRQWNTDLYSFRSNTLFNMKLSSPYSVFLVGSSNSTIATGTGTANAIPGTYSVQVNQIAQSATFTGTPTLKGTDPITTSNSTMQITGADGRIATIKIGTDTTNGSANTIQDLVSKINSLVDDTTKKPMGLQAIFDGTLNKFVIKTKDTGAATNIGVSFTDGAVPTALGLSPSANQPLVSSQLQNGQSIDPTKTLVSQLAPISNNTTLSISVGDATYDPIPISANDKITDIVQKLNNAIPSAGEDKDRLQASYNSMSNQFVLTTSLGKTVTLNWKDNGTDKGNLFAAASGQPAFFAVGQDAKVNFSNGQNITQNVSVSSNSATLYGVTYQFVNPGTSTMTVSNDIDTEVKNIQDFVSKYNDMMDKVYNTMNEPVYSDYQPLTDDQRTAMTADQITQWETKSKSGLLHNDDILSSLYNQMRMDTITVVNNGSSYNTLSSIGIASASYQDHGKLYVDETKLRAAIQADPNAVRSIFSGSDDTDSTKNGVVTRLYNDFNDSITKLTTKAGAKGNSQNDQSTVGKLLIDVTTKMDNEKQRLTNVENNYYTQFSNMETAMSQYNSQSSSLLSSLGMSSSTGGH